MNVAPSSPRYPLETIWTDVRRAARMFRNSAAFAATVVAILSLGVGANSAIFGVCCAVLLEPLPVPAILRR